MSTEAEFIFLDTIQATPTNHLLGAFIGCPFHWMWFGHHGTHTTITASHATHIEGKTTGIRPNLQTNFIHSEVKFRHSLQGIYQDSLQPSLSGVYRDLTWRQQLEDWRRFLPLQALWRGDWWSVTSQWALRPHIFIRWLCTEPTCPEY